MQRDGPVGPRASVVRKPGGKPACVSGAAGARPSRAGRPARHAGRKGRRRRSCDTTEGAPPAAAPGAAGRSWTAGRAVRDAPPLRTPASARSARTRAPGSCMPNGDPGRYVHHAERRPRGRPVAPHAPSAPTTARRIFGGCRSIRRATPCSCAAPTSRLPSSTTRWRSLPGSPSGGSTGIRWRSSSTRPGSPRWPPGNSSAAAGRATGLPPSRVSPPCRQQHGYGGDPVFDRPPAAGPTFRSRRKAFEGASAQEGRGSGASGPIPRRSPGDEDV